jgi:type IV secretory pathway TraG/TraD family ATPase VirD4
VNRVQDLASLDLRARRALREKALRNVKVACATAWASTAWAVIARSFFADSLELRLAFWRVVVGAVVTAGLGCLMWFRESRAAAWSLGLLASVNLVLRVVATESFYPAIVGGLFCLAYYRGWRGAEVLHELRQTEVPAVPPFPMSSGS